MIEFFYMAGSPPCRAVALCIKYLDLEVTYKKMDLYGKAEHLEPWFKKLNPTHTVPTIIDDGFVLWESHAIMPYLVEKYGSSDQLYPKDLEKRAIVDRMLYFDMGLYKSMTDYFQPQLLGLSPDPVKLKPMTQNLEYLDFFLSLNKFAAGNEITIADLAIIGTIGQLEGMEYNYIAYTHIFDWSELVRSEMPYYNDCCQDGIALFQDWVNTKTKYKTVCEL